MTMLGPTIAFSRWLDAQRQRDDGVGDLARDARYDREWPRRAGIRRLHEHLSRCRACEGAHESLDRAWREWGGREEAR